MLLKLNKEGPFKKDVFRAPGHQGNMRKLIHFLQQVIPLSLKYGLLAGIPLRAYLWLPLFSPFRAVW